ncbi:MAG: protease pro-enzyme activation domain-containing protein [Chthoniobacterales bacterium]
MSVISTDVPQAVLPTPENRREKQTMKGLGNVVDRYSPVRFALAAGTPRPLASALLGIVIYLVVPTREAAAASRAIVDLSPMVAKSILVSPTDLSKEISVIFVLPLKDGKRATEFAERVSSPGDELYGKFLTPDQFAAAYGADQADYTAIKNWAVGSGLTISEDSISRTTLTVTGTVGQFESLFNAQINNYRSPDGEGFYSVGIEPVIPGSISDKLIGLIGLSSSTRYAPLIKVYKKLSETSVGKEETNTPGGSGPGGAYNAADLHTAYFIPTSFGGTVPQTVAVFEQGGFAKSDVTKYLETNHLPPVPAVLRGVNGYRGGINDPNVELEAVLDIDMVIGMNPAVQKVLVYEDGKDPFAVALLDALKDVADDNLVQTLSISYGTDEVIQGKRQVEAEGQVFVQLAAEGITVLVSAGDDGAYGRSAQGLNASDPGAQPLVTSVGGTTLYTAPHAVYQGEEVWNLLGIGDGATGGGVSKYWLLPSWQPAKVMTKNGGSATHRNFPDVAAVADPLTGVAVYSSLFGGWQEIGGTSVSAPLWAGFLSSLNSSRETVGLGKIGFFNPFFYKIARVNQANMLNDILDGTNGNAELNHIPGYNAGPGYDDCSGWGTMIGEEFASVYLTSPIKSGKLPGNFGGVTGTAQGTSAKLSWAQSSCATGYLVELLQGGYPIPFDYVSKGINIDLTGLAPDTTYEVLVYALNLSGSTQSSNTINLTTGD